VYVCLTSLSKYIVYVTILPCNCCFADKMILNVGCTYHIYQASLYHMTLTETFICNVTFPLLIKAAWRDVNWKIFHRISLSSEQNVLITTVAQWVRRSSGVSAGKGTMPSSDPIFFCIVVYSTTMIIL